METGTSPVGKCVYSLCLYFISSLPHSLSPFLPASYVCWDQAQDFELRQVLYHSAVPLVIYLLIFINVPGQIIFKCIKKFKLYFY